MAVDKGHENHLVSAQRITALGTMLADERAAGIARGKKLATAEGKSERGGVGAECTIRNDVFFDRIRPFRPDTRIKVLAEK